ncbi:TylF/MycF/NovP-related O-methyltransferase [Desulfococcaceae bacterium HSG9]|nr:TylF/MycF/NovP-related O-methyltransferase [Desulfococcaceae bacterium HSG9]
MIINNMDFDGFYETIVNYTLLDAERIHSLMNLTQDVNHRKIEGDIVECGSCKGGSSAALRVCMGDYRKLWIYDSFEGLPETNKKDGQEAKKWIGDCKSTVQNVLEVMALTNAKDEEFVIRKGLFSDTFRQTLPKKVALLHCDADWYESVMLVLETFYPLIPDGGVVILDDFGHWEGCRVAFYDFCKKFDEQPLLERVDYTQAYWIKGKKHKRNG